jgi:hypothetical protein
MILGRWQNLQKGKAALPKRKENLSHRLSEIYFLDDFL